MIMKNIPKAGEVVTLVQFVHQCKYTGNLIVTSCNMSGSGYPLFGKAEISFVMPNGDQFYAAVTALQQEAKSERANHHVKITQLEDKIQQLLAIGHDGGDA
jgi:hypothetical protein